MSDDEVATTNRRKDSRTARRAPALEDSDDDDGETEMAETDDAATATTTTTTTARNANFEFSEERLRTAVQDLLKVMKEYPKDDDRTITDDIGEESLQGLDLSIAENVAQHIRLRGWHFVDTEPLIRYLTRQTASEDGLTLECQYLVTAVAAQTLWECNNRGANEDDDPPGKPKDRKMAQKLFVSPKGDEDKGNTVANYVTNRWPSILLRTLQQSEPLSPPTNDIRVSIVECSLSFIRRAFVIDSEKKLSKLKSLQGMDWQGFTESVLAWARKARGMDQLADAASLTQDHLKSLSPPTDVDTTGTGPALAPTADSASARPPSPVVDSLTQAAERAKEERRRQMKSRLGRGTIAIHAAPVTVRAPPQPSSVTAPLAGPVTIQGHDGRNVYPQTAVSGGVSSGRARNDVAAASSYSQDDPRGHVSRSKDEGVTRAPPGGTWDRAIPVTDEQMMKAWEAQHYAVPGAEATNSFPPSVRNVRPYEVDRSLARENEASRAEPPYWPNESRRHGSDVVPYGTFENADRDPTAFTSDRRYSENIVVNNHNQHGSSTADFGRSTNDVYPPAVANNGTAYPSISARGFPPVHNNQSEDGTRMAQPDIHRQFSSGDLANGGNNRSWGGDSTENPPQRNDGNGFRGNKRQRRAEQPPPKRGKGGDQSIGGFNHGRGRGRGRGLQLTQPAWMTKQLQGEGPVGGPPTSAGGGGGGRGGSGSENGSSQEAFGASQYSDARGQGVSQDRYGDSQYAQASNLGTSQDRYGERQYPNASSLDAPQERHKDVQYERESRNHDYSAPQGGGGRGRHQTKPAWMTRQEGPTGIGRGPDSAPPTSVASVPSDGGLGRGRGRGRTLPAWMTAQQQQA